jgi:hypothetical protein
MGRTRRSTSSTLASPGRVLMIFGFYGLSVLQVAIWVVILIKLWQREGSGMGIVGLICGLYTFYWGWRNCASLDYERQSNNESPMYKTAMIVWTVLIVAGGIFRHLA